MSLLDAVLTVDAFDLVIHLQVLVDVSAQELASIHFSHRWLHGDFFGREDTIGGTCIFDSSHSLGGSRFDSVYLGLFLRLACPPRALADEILHFSLPLVLPLPSSIDTLSQLGLILSVDRISLS